MRTWAVSGGSGFVGGHLARRLAEAGDAVRTLDVARAEPAPAASGIERLAGDVRDPTACARLCRGAEVLVHAAAALPARGSPSEIRSVNVEGTAALLAAAARAGVRRVVFLSSAVVYGLPDRVPVDEGAPAEPFEAYGRSKREAERLVLASELEAVVLRPAAVVGPGRLGVFGILFDWVREGRRIYTIGPGRNRYQLLAVDDLVEAVVAAADRPVVGEVLNVGAAVTGTVAADLAALVAHAGTGSRVTPLPERAAQHALRLLAAAGLSPLSAWHIRTAGLDVVCDVGKAARLLDWRASRSSAEALVEAYDAHVAGGDGRVPTGATHRTRWDEGALRLLRRVS